MRLAIAILASVAVTAILVAVVANLRRFLLIRQLSFVLFVAAVAAGIKTFTLIQPGEFENFAHALSWIRMFLTAITVIRIALIKSVPSGSIHRAELTRASLPLMETSRPSPSPATSAIRTRVVSDMGA